MKITLYKTTDQNNTINKNLTDPLEININLKRSEDQERPRLLLKNDNDKYNGYNYAYIDFFKRYYFVESTSNNNDRIIELQLETDVLETYKDDILETNAENNAYYSSSENLDIRKNEDIYSSNITLPETNSMVIVTTGSGGGNKWK